MGTAKKDLELCFSCNLETTDVDRHSIFYTFLEGTGDLLADVLERCLLLPQIAVLPVSNPVLCGKCYSLFEELSSCEKKVMTLRRELWGLYKAALIDRNEDVTKFIRGSAVQTDLSYLDEAFDAGEGSQDFAVECKIESDKESEETGRTDAVEEGITESATKEEQPAAINGGKWWKRRGATCIHCGKWFKTKAELSQHATVHSDRDNQPQVEPVDGSGGQIWRECSKCSSMFNNVSEYKAHVKSHMIFIKSHRGVKPSKPVTIYECRLCERKLRSKAGATYHAKSHNFQVDKDFDLKEVFRVSVDGVLDAEEGEYTPSTVIIVHHEEPQEDSSSDDELPLAKRRKEFIFEKIKQGLNSESSDSKKNSEPKKALEALKSCSDVQVVKIAPPVKVVRVPPAPGQVFPVELLQDAENADDPAEEEDGGQEDFLNSTLDDDSADEVDKDGENRLTIDPDELAAHLTAPRQRGRPRIREITLSTLLKMKGRDRKKSSSEIFPVMKEPRFKCDICNKMWKTRGELNAHRTTHSDARPYICEICGQAYKHKPALDVHVGMHRGIYQHQCPYCKKAFTQKGALQRHLPIHTGDLPYQCELCGKRFVHRTSFSIHTMAHTGVRNIKCEVCNMGVLSKSHLRRHMRIHSGEKPYDCQTCGKAFAERYNLVAHQRIHDPNQTGPTRTQKRKPITCRLCNAVFDRRHKLEDHMVVAHNKVVEEPIQQQRSNSFDSGELYATHRFVIPEPAVTIVKNDCTTEHAVKKEESPSVDLSRRSVHTARNVEVLRNPTDIPRGLELLRMANGMVEATHNWGYSNPST